MAVSVIIPAYNAAATIVRSVQSVLRQAGVAQVLVVDDASADGTLAAARGIQDARVQVLSHPQNQGAAAARNTGLAAATSEWVAFQDADDEWLPDKLAIQLRALAKTTDAAFCYTDMTRVRADGQETPYPAPDVTQRVLVDPRTHDYAALRIGIGTCVIRRNALRAVGPFDGTLRALEDLDLLTRLLQKGSGLHVALPLVRYHEGQGVSSNPGRLADARLRLLARYQSMVQDRRFVALQRRIVAEHLFQAGRVGPGLGQLVRCIAADAGQTGRVLRLVGWVALGRHRRRPSR